MRISLNWLKDYVEIKQTPQELYELFNAKILEVESFQAGGAVKGVVVAQIKEVNQHPQADKLHVLKVDTGREDLPIVCGAANVRVGLKTALALVGAELPGGIKLGVAKLRGVDSYGMCCSEKELGLADTSTGIIELPDDAPVGQDFAEYAGLADSIYELGILPNRGDLQSYRNIAIEVAAASGAKLKLPEIKKNIQVGTQKKADITIEAPDLCGRYMSCILKVKIAPSPDWLQKRLRAGGLRPINNVVDVTNFVLNEIGQPLHTFDYDQLRGGQIIVRRAKSGEAIQTLDGKQIKLTQDMLVIADAEKPSCLAGIMGGWESGVSDTTQYILLEAAYFNPLAIRQTSRATALRSDSSIRYEKQISYDGVADGFYRALELFRQTAQAEVVSNIVDLDPGRPRTLTVELRPDRVRRILGVDIAEQRIVEILTALRFQPQKQGAGYLVTVPSGRAHDVYREIDLIEEIARIYGYAEIPSTYPQLVVQPEGWGKRDRVLAILRRVLQSGGLSETMSYSMTAPDIYQKIGLTNQFQDPLKITNPLSAEESVLRQSLWPQLIMAVAANQAQRIANVALYEIGRVYTRQGEASRVAAVLTGDLSLGALGKEQSIRADFFTLKGLVEAVLAECGIPLQKLRRSRSPFLHPGKSFDLPLLSAGELSPLILKKVGLVQSVLALEIDLDLLVKMADFDRVFADFSAYPSAARDMAFLVDKQITAAEIEQVIYAAAGESLERVELFDYYTGQNIPDGKVSLAYALTYRAPDRTLKDEEINERHERIVQALRRELQVELR
ncbi:phenylalanyl-tRNA synthetase subunit beta [Candidatus Termititenax persephonae]|uniref:Phenylalanine--tRNA ligase beta subunit n=1 Tax=Candidatus Termititenax persephonae TaxID=2218525 RepID=A0A388TFE5_9BACT|nr:phenylalanyl-tRNA synthetase subunit beta [Candidatus Termititenax persephonae]